MLGANKGAYIAGLDNFREDRVDDWVAQFARAVEASAEQAEDFSERVTDLQASWLERVGPLRRDATARAIVESLPSFPLITTKIVQELTSRSDVAALSGLDRPERAGVLVRHRNRRKGDAWEAKELLDLLDAFEEAVKLPA